MQSVEPARFPKHMDMRPQPPSHPPQRRRTRSVSTAPIINEDDVVVRQSPGRELAEAMFEKWRSVAAELKQGLHSIKHAAMHMASSKLASALVTWRALAAAEQGQMLIDNLVIHYDTSRMPMLPTVEFSYTSGMPAPRVESYSFLVVQRM